MEQRNTRCSVRCYILLCVTHSTQKKKKKRYHNLYLHKLDGKGGININTTFEISKPNIAKSLNNKVVEFYTKI